MSPPTDRNTINYFDLCAEDLPHCKRQNILWREHSCYSGQTESLQPGPSPISASTPMTHSRHDPAICYPCKIRTFALLRNSSFDFVEMNYLLPGTQLICRLI